MKGSIRFVVGKQEWLEEIAVISFMFTSQTLLRP